MMTPDEIAALQSRMQRIERLSYITAGVVMAHTGITLLGVGL